MDEFGWKLEQFKSGHQNTEQKVNYKCRKCRDTGFILHRQEGMQDSAVECECYAVRQAKELLDNSGISEGFRKKTFDNFNPSGNPQLANAKEHAVRYAHSFIQTEHDRYNSIMFSGQAGAGKTHLGMAICSTLLSAGVAVIYMPYRDAVTRIKHNIIDEEVYNREIKRYAKARLLYIDDLLKGRLTETDVNIMYEIINYRYMNNKPIIISTEKSPNDMLVFDEAIGSRILEMCKGNIIRLQGKELNYRLS